MNNTDTKTILPEGAASDKHGFMKWLPVIILSLALMIIVLDTTILNVSLKTLVHDLNTDIEGMQWVITSYALTLAALTITGGRMGDLYGRKKMFMVGAVIFAIGSFVTSISHSVGVMIIGESVIEGVGAALMMPATASLLISNYRGRDRALAFGVWGGMAAAAAALGPIVGGFLTTNYSWRWAFRINIFVAGILLIGAYFISESRDREEKQELDYLGVFLSAFGLLLLVFGIIESSTYGWWQAEQTFNLFGHSFGLAGLSVTPVAVFLGLMVLTLFGVWQHYQEKHGHTPLVSLRIFTNQQFTAGTLVTAVMALGQVGTIFALPVFFQSVRNLDALHTGIALLPMPLTLLVAAPASARISAYVTPKRIVQVGLFINILATGVLYHSITIDATPADLALGLAMFGLGMGLVMAQVSNLTLSAVSVEESGEASGLNNTFRQIGSSFGAAIIGAALIATLGTSLQTGISTSSVIPADQKQKIMEIVKKSGSAVEFGGIPTGDVMIPKQIQNELTRVAHQASTDGSRQAMMLTGAFGVLGFITAMWLPNVQDVEKNASLASKH